MWKQRAWYLYSSHHWQELVSLIQHYNNKNAACNRPSFFSRVEKCAKYYARQWQKVCPANLLKNPLNDKILHSRKTETAHCAFFAVSRHKHLQNISSSDIVGNQVSGFCFFFKERHHPPCTAADKLTVLHVAGMALPSNYHVYPGYKLPVAHLLVGHSRMRKRPLVGVLLLLLN